MDCNALYERWTGMQLEDEDLTKELASIKGKEDEINSLRLAEV